MVGSALALQIIRSNAYDIPLLDLLYTLTTSVEQIVDTNIVLTWNKLNMLVNPVLF